MIVGVVNHIFCAMLMTNAAEEVDLHEIPGKVMTEEKTLYFLKDFFVAEKGKVFNDGVTCFINLPELMEQMIITLLNTETKNVRIIVFAAFFRFELAREEADTLRLKNETLEKQLEQLDESYTQERLQAEVTVTSVRFTAVYA